MKFYKLCSAKLMKRNTAAAMILAAIAGSLAGCGRIADIGKDKAADIALDIILDSPPSLSLLTVNGMIAADYLILPVQTEFYAMEGVAQLLESMQMVQKAMNPHLRLLGVLATMYDKRTMLSSQVLTEMERFFKSKVFQTTIPRNVRVAEAPSHRVPVGAYDKFSKGAKAYKEFAREVEERIAG